MKDAVSQVVSRLRPFAERDGAELEVFHVDEDFGVVEICLRRRPDAHEDALSAVRYAVEQMILRQVQGVRQVEFVEEPGLESAPAPASAAAPSPPELSALRSGAALACDILLDLETALRGDLAADALKRRHSAEHLLCGPYRNWLEDAARNASPDRAPGASPEDALPPLRESFFNLDRAARAFARTLDGELRAWEAEPGALRDDALPRALRAPERRELEQALGILEELRPRLGDRTLEGFLANEGAKTEATAAPTVTLLDRIFKDALHQKVRDVYLDLGQSSAVLQYRVGRRVERVLSFSTSLYPPLLARIKHLASLDVADRRRRQEGLICFTASSGYGGLTVQVQTIPGQFAERVRFRLHLPSPAAKALP